MPVMKFVAEEQKTMTEVLKLSSKIVGDNKQIITACRNLELPLEADVVVAIVEGAVMWCHWKAVDAVM